MRYSQAEKMEIIRIVESSELGIKRTLKELDICRSTYYQWYRKYKEEGFEGLSNRKSNPKRIWNKMPNEERCSFFYYIEQSIINQTSYIIIKLG